MAESNKGPKAGQPLNAKTASRILNTNAKANQGPALKNSAAKAMGASAHSMRKGGGRGR